MKDLYEKCSPYYCYPKSWLKGFRLSLYFPICPFYFWPGCCVDRRHVITLICVCEGVQRTMPYCGFFFFFLEITDKCLPNLSSIWRAILGRHKLGANLVSHPWCLKVFEKSRRMCIYLIRDSAVLSHDFGPSVFHRGVLQHLSYCVFVLNLKSWNMPAQGFSNLRISVS